MVYFIWILLDVLYEADKINMNAVWLPENFLTDSPMVSKMLTTLVVREFLLFFTGAMFVFHDLNTALGVSFTLLISVLYIL